MVAKKGGGVRPTTRDLDVKLTRNYAVIVLLSTLGVGLSITEVCESSIDCPPHLPLASCAL